MVLTCNEIIVVLHLNYFSSEKTGYTLPPGVYEIRDINRTLELLLSDTGKLNITNSETRLKSNLYINQTLLFTKNSFFVTILGFIQTHSGPLNDIDEFFQLIPRNYKSQKPINITGVDKINLKCDCIQGSIVDGVREPISYSFGLSSPPGHEIFKEPKIKLFKEINKSVLSHITFNFQYNDHRPVDLNGEAIRLNCQLIKI